jgi:anti-sigma factor RsiW
MNHSTEQISDYVLGILESAEIPILEQHANSCEQCRAAIAQERQLLQRIGMTFAAAPKPTHAHLMRRMPTPPTRQAVGQMWQRSATVMAMIVFLLIGGFMLQPAGSTSAVATPVPSLVALTATVTNAAPTATPTQLAQRLFVTPVPEPVHGY